MPKANFKRSTRRVVATALATPWMIERGTLDQIRTLLEDRANNRLLSRDEISERIGRPAGSGSGVIKASNLDFEPDEDDQEGPYVVDGVAVLPLFGVLAPRLSWMDELSGGTSTELFQNWMNEALDDSRVSSILIHVDSPGGSAQGNEELAESVRASRGRKPICAVVTGMAASAAYYICSAAETVIASPSSEVGSIGVYMIHSETSAADAEAGVKYTVIKAGENKAAGNSVEPLTAKTRGVLQERIDAFYSQFVQAVADNRGVDSKTVEANMGQGKVMIAQAALSAGLIDQIGTFGEALESMRKPQNSTAAKSTRGAASTLRNDESAGVVPPKLTSEPSRETSLQGSVTMLKVKAALVKKGMMAEEASDDVMTGVLAGYFGARGQSVPSTEDAILAVLDPPPRQLDEKAIKAAERLRISELQTRGRLLRMSETDILSAIDDGLDVGQALTVWTDKAAAKDTPVEKRILSGLQEADVFPQAVVDGLFHRATAGKTSEAAKLSPAARDCGRMRLLDIGSRMLSLGGTRVNLSDPDQVADAMLGGNEPGRKQSAIRAVDIGYTTDHIRADTTGVGYNRPGDFPGVLSALMGKMLDQAEELVTPTYPSWTAKIESVQDFKPKTIHAIGEFGELPEHEDAAPFDESVNAEEAAWLQVSEYADNWTLTPRMIINDDLQALQDVAYAKQEAHELTMERLCVNLLTGNAAAQDNVSLFDYSTRAATVNGQSVNINDVASGSGGAPSTTQLALMRKYARKIYGLNLKQKLNQTLKMILIPEDLEQATESVLLVGTGAGTGAGVGNVMPITEANTQLFRGRVMYKVVPLLAEASAAQWYAITDSLRTAIVTTHMKGFEQMRATSWYEPRNGCRIWNFMGRMAAAIRTWRTILRNAGA